MQLEPGRQQGPADPDPQRGEVAGPTTEEVADEIARDLLAIHHDSYGRPAASAEAHVLGDTVIVLLDGLELLPNEEFLIGEGQRGGRRQDPHRVPEGDRADLQRRGGAGHRSAGDRLRQPYSDGGAPLHVRDLPPRAHLAPKAAASAPAGRRSFG